MESVTAHCTDGSVYTGSILVGADGARSKIRQWMYRGLDDKWITEPLDPEVCPPVKDTKSVFTIMCPNNEPQTTAVMNIPDNRVAWMVIANPTDFPPPHTYAQISKLSPTSAIRSAWGPDAAFAMSNALKPTSVPYGGERFGALLEHTRSEKISKVLLEEKIFKTWSSGRVVLLGDGKKV
ncbi:hypothetical protein BGZ93_005047 [Podila epicladia]|nr:hypothetical protein BGZ93_005047 [Podila epicladia]